MFYVYFYKVIIMFLFVKKYLKKVIINLEILIINIIKFFEGFYDNFDYKNAYKFYSIEIGYIINEKTSLCDLDDILDKHMKSYGGEWTASDCGPFTFAVSLKNAEMVRCNNYTIYNLNLDLKKFKSDLPYMYFIDDIKMGYKNKDKYRFERVKIE